MSTFCKVGVALIVVALIGCAATRAAKKWERRMDPLVGSSKQTVAIELGTPMQVVEINDTSEVWNYTFDYGVSSWANRNVWTGEYRGSSNRRQWDKLDLFFVNDRLSRWKVYCQR